MCEYCDKKDSNKSLIDMDDSVIDTGIYIQDNRIVVEQSQFGYDSVEIHFCPMCGRKLGD